VEQASAELVSLGICHPGYDKVRSIGRAAPTGQGAADQLCGRCGDGTALVKPDGTVAPCTMARWISVGNVQSSPLGEVLAAMPAARHDLTARGMPATVTTTAQGNCTPCGPQGNCYPIHCHPRA
jgi:radical SAM protein with 4Fe4S-binding SPASM domain